MTDNNSIEYVSLHNHTIASLFDSLIKPIDLFKRAKELGMKAVAVTDHGSLFGAWDSLLASRSTGVKLIMGEEFYFVEDVKEQEAKSSHIILLAKNEVGYKNLLLISSKGYDNYQIKFKRVFPRIDWDIMKQHCEGLICITACANGVLGQCINEKNTEEAERRALRLKDIFGDNLAIELQAHGLKRISTAYGSEIDQVATNLKLRAIADKFDIRPIVTTDAHYLTKEQAPSHNVLMAMAAGVLVDSVGRLNYDVPDFYLKTGEEVLKKLTRIMKGDEGFARKCVDNTVYFANMCEKPEWIDLKYSNPSGKELPDFPVKDQPDYNEFLSWLKCNEQYAGLEEDKSYLRYVCELKFKEMGMDELGKPGEYRARLEEELDVLYYCGVASYMLIVGDYVNWARNNGISVGPGRGCLTKDTLVLTETGHRPLGDIEVGDKVYSHTGNLRSVLNKFEYDIDEVGLEISTDSGSNTLKLTKDHEVFVYPGDWTAAEDLKVNDKIFKDKDNYYTINLIDELKLSKVYDITVEEDHSYLTSNGVVHNSVSGSLVAYLLVIHEADPIKYGLLFARFHNKLKQAYSDIDVDFATSGRHRVVEYIKNKYGEDKVATISNYNTLTPKVYARRMANAFMYGGDRKKAVQVGNLLADSIPKEVSKLTGIFEKAPLFNEYAEIYKELKLYAEDLNKQIVAVSTHAAGLVIGKRALNQLVPIRRDKDGLISIEYEKNRAEDVGLVKMDILGLSTLDVIDNTIEIIKSIGKELKPFDYFTYDKEAYDLISRGNTLCVFQFGTSGGTIDLCKRFQPVDMEGLALITTLARPAAKEIRNEFFKVKDGEKEIELLHPLLERSFVQSLGFALYDESLLTLVEDLAGWDLHEADRLRKITKDKGKNPEKTKKCKADFIQSAFENKQISNEKAEEIWANVIEPYSKYSFNKAHAVTYSMISYHTAWLKAHYPLEFLVANLRAECLSNALKAKDNISNIKEEIRKINVKILPPNINTSDIAYKIIDDHTIATGFEAIKNIRTDSIPEILAKRPFTSIEDFISKIDTKKVTSATIQALAASGCFDSFNKNRRTIFLYASDFKKKYANFLKRKNAKALEFVYPWPEEDDWTVSERCALERKYVGESFGDDKVKEYAGFFTYTAINFKNLPKLLPFDPELDEMESRKYIHKITSVQGEIKSIFEFKVKKEGSKILGETMGKLVIEDPYGNRLNVTCFPDGLVKLKERAESLSGGKQKLDVGCGVYINGNLNWYDGELGLVFGDLARFSPPPQEPSDLKSKKVIMRQLKESKEENTKEITETDDRTSILDEIESELIEAGQYDDFDFEDQENDN